ncbi:MAG: FCD domain-containing protein, partial [Candidatus Dormibacteraeota bacterium]|nr:FCD domain-containing protein [Candidatus Dormibacteraeota bacterium]MBJ7601618.1 FCD domain-containing protein [Candidatus Dormibacteraeota bacterium]
DLEMCLDVMRRFDHDLEQFLHANWSLHERIAAVTPNDLARAMYVALMRCIAELSVRADPETYSTSSDYLAERMVKHEELVAAIRLGDEERVRAAVAAHGGDAESGVVNGGSERLSAAVEHVLPDGAPVKLGVADQ